MPVLDAEVPQKLSTPQKRRAIISLTPLIDVVFILLVFFMLASSFTKFRSIELNAATSGQAAASNGSQQLLLRVTVEGFILEGEQVSDMEMIDRVKAHTAKSAEHKLLIQPGAELPLQRLVNAVELLRSKGLIQLDLIKDPTWREGETSITKPSNVQ